MNIDLYWSIQRSVNSKIQLFASDFVEIAPSITFSFSFSFISKNKKYIYTANRNIKLLDFHSRRWCYLSISIRFFHVYFAIFPTFDAHLCVLLLFFTVLYLYNSRMFSFFLLQTLFCALQLLFYLFYQEHAGIIRRKSCYSIERKIFSPKVRSQFLQRIMNIRKK